MNRRGRVHRRRGVALRPTRIRDGLPVGHGRRDSPPGDGHARARGRAVARIRGRRGPESMRYTPSTELCVTVCPIGALNARNACRISRQVRTGLCRVLSAGSLEVGFGWVTCGLVCVADRAVLVANRADGSCVACLDQEWRWFCCCVANGPKGSLLDPMGAGFARGVPVMSHLSLEWRAGARPG